MGWVSGKKEFGEKVDGGGVRKQEVEAARLHLFTSLIWRRRRMVTVVVIMRMVILIDSCPAKTIHETKTSGGLMGLRWTHGGF